MNSFNGSIYPLINSPINTLQMNNYRGNLDIFKNQQTYIEINTYYYAGFIWEPLYGKRLWKKNQTFLARLFDNMTVYCQIIWKKIKRFSQITWNLYVLDGMLYR